MLTAINHARTLAVGQEIWIRGTADDLRAAGMSLVLGEPAERCGQTQACDLGRSFPGQIRVHGQCYNFDGEPWIRLHRDTDPAAGLFPALRHLFFESDTGKLLLVAAGAVLLARTVGA